MSLILNLPGPAYAQLAAGLPNTMGVINARPVYQAPVISGLNVHPENPFLFDFIVNPGAQKVQGEALKSESERLVKYFLTAMTLPDKEAWVNLSPYEANRIIPDALGHTEMGKIMLEQDYQLKQLAASLTNPETDLGKKYWEQLKALSPPHQPHSGKMGEASPNFNNLAGKVWVVPGQAEVVEQDGKVFVTGNRLKVMLEEDYAALSQNKNNLTSDDQAQNAKATAIFRQLILPQLEKEVNEGKTFAPIRQVYNSAILAVWYKQSLKESLLGKIYVNQQKIKGVEVNDISFKNNVYQQYLEAFKKGAYHLIKEEEQDGEVVPRKYFSGGAEVIPSQVIITRGAVGSSGISEQDVAVTVQLDAETPAAKIVGNRAKSIEPTAMTFKPVLKTSASSTIAEAKAKFFAEVRAALPATLGSELDAVSSRAQTFYRKYSESVRKDWRQAATIQVKQVLLWAMIEAYRIDDQDNRERAKQNARKVFTGNYKDEIIENMAEWIVRFEKWQRDPYNDELLMDVISLLNSQSMKKVENLIIRVGVPKGNPFAKIEAWQLAVQGAAMQFFFETGHISWLLRTMLIEDIHYWIAFRELRPDQMSPGAYYMSEIIDEMKAMGMTPQPDVALPAYSAEFSFADHGSIAMKEVQRLSHQASRLGVSEEGKFFRFGLMSALKDQITEQLKEQFPRLFEDENFERFYIAIDSQTGALAIAFRQPGPGLSFESRMLLINLGDLPENPQDIQSIKLGMTQYGAEIKPEHKAAIEAAVSRVLFRMVSQPQVDFKKVETSASSTVAEAKAKFFAEVRAALPEQLVKNLRVVLSTAEKLADEYSRLSQRENDRATILTKKQAFLWALIKAYRIDDQERRERAKEYARIDFNSKMNEPRVDSTAELLVRVEKWQRDPQNDELLMEVISLLNLRILAEVEGFFNKYQAIEVNPIAEIRAWQRTIQGKAMQFFVETGHISQLLKSLGLENIYHWIVEGRIPTGHIDPEYHMFQIIYEMKNLLMASPPAVSLPEYVVEFNFEDYGPIETEEVERLSEKAKMFGKMGKGQSFRVGLASALQSEITSQLRDQFPDLYRDWNPERSTIVGDPQIGALAISFGVHSNPLLNDPGVYVISLGELPENSQDIQGIKLTMTQYGTEMKPEYKTAIETAVSRVLFRLVVQSRVGFVKAEPSSASSGVKDVRLGVVDQPTAKPGQPARQEYGGIDFDPTLMNLQIKRDSKGVPLPLPQQNLENIHIEGVYPIIINIQPAVPANYPLLVKKS